MSVPCYDDADFEIVLEDLCSDDTTSIDELCSDDTSLDEEFGENCLKRRRLLRINQDGCKKTKVFEDPYGQVIEFKAKFPKPRLVLSTDIRRSYANMFTNMTNSCSFAMVYGFLDTFCCPTTSRVSTRSALRRDPKTITQEGIVGICLHKYARMLVAPDSVMKLLDTNILHMNKSNESKVVAKFSVEGTETLTMPEGRQCSDPKCKGCSLDHYIQKIMKQKQLTYSLDKKSNNVIQNITNFVEEVIDTLPVRTVPLPYKSEGVLVLHLDDMKRITKIQIDFVAL